MTGRFLGILNFHFSNEKVYTFLKKVLQSYIIFVLFFVFDYFALNENSPTTIEIRLQKNSYRVNSLELNFSCKGIFISLFSAS